MTAGSVIVLAFWVIFTVRKHFTPKLAVAEKANTYDLNRDNPEAKRAAQRRRGPLAAARWALRVAGWAENVLAVLILDVKRMTAKWKKQDRERFAALQQKKGNAPRR